MFINKWGFFSTAKLAGPGPLKKSFGLLNGVSQESNRSSQMSKKGIIQKFRKCCLLIPLSIALSGLTVLMYQSWFWLKLGSWKPLASRLVLDKVLPADFLHWLHNPSSWSGLKKIISPFFNFPLALFLVLTGLVILQFVAKIFDFFSKSQQIKVIDTRSWRTG